MPKCPEEYCLRNDCQVSDLTKLPAAMFKCGKCDIPYVNHMGAKQHMKEKHPVAVEWDREKTQNEDVIENGMLIDFLQQILPLHSLNPNYFVFSGHAHSDNLRSTTLGRPPKIHHPSFTGVRMPLAEEVQKEPSGRKIKQMRFDEPPFDPVTRDGSI